jgi:transmembrane 9 superfamily protein 3
MMVIFLTGLVSMILMRTLRNDYAKYAREEDDLETLERDVREESGWKLVHGDVFRSPRNLVLLSALVGTGAQLAMLILLVILLAIVGMLYVGRGAIVTTFIVCYALTAFISGYVSGGFYSRNEGKNLYTPSSSLCSSYHIILLMVTSPLIICLSLKKMIICSSH